MAKQRTIQEHSSLVLESAKIKSASSSKLSSRRIPSVARKRPISNTIRTTNLQTLQIPQETWKKAVLTHTSKPQVFKKSLYTKQIQQVYEIERSQIQKNLQEEIRKKSALLDLEEETKTLQELYQAEIDYYKQCTDDVLEENENGDISERDTTEPEDSMDASTSEDEWDQ